MKKTPWIIASTLAYTVSSWVVAPAPSEQPPVVEAVEPKDILDDMSMMLALSGKNCWDLDTNSGAIPEVLIVFGADSREVDVIPFDDEAWNLAESGKVWVLYGCEVL